MAKSKFQITQDLGSMLFSYDEIQNKKNSGTIDTYYANRSPAASYDSYQSNAEFNSYDLRNRDPEDIYVRLYEQDSSGGYHAVEYVFDDNMNMYHVVRDTPAILEETENADGSVSQNWKVGDTWNERCTYVGDGTILNTTETVTVNDNTELTVDQLSEERYYENTGYNLSVEDITTFQSTWEHETDGSEFFNSRAILGIFGIPYQFMPHVDPRIDASRAGSGAYLTLYSSPGREYANHIVSNMPILFLSPGLPNFAATFGDEDKVTIGTIMTDIASGLGGAASTEDLLQKQGKYYTFQYEVPQYYQYCNPACRIASGYMNVSDKTIDGTRIDSLNWMEYTTKTLSGIFKDLGDITSYTSIPFYIESDTQISESFSNDITDSSLTGIVDSVSDLGREAMFILGYGNSALNAGIDWLSKTDNPDAIRADITSKFGSLADGNGFVSNIISNLTSVATGGRLIFPKIWSDSSFSRSYDVTIKLRSPDMDNLSIYCNIIVPFLHLLCFVLPRQIQDNPNGFYSPFIVRGIYKGFFNIDMGIVSSMNVTKGDTGLWNADGIPCSIDVNLTITDLYESISMTGTSTTNLAYDTLDNTCFMDYIANLCGINIYLPEVARTLRMWLVNNVTNRAADMINVGLWGNIQNSIANAITNVWRRS